MNERLRDSCDIYLRKALETPQMLQIQFEGQLMSISSGPTYLYITLENGVFQTHLVKSILNLKQKIGFQYSDILCVGIRQKCRQLQKSPGQVSFFANSD